MSALGLSFSQPISDFGSQFCERMSARKSYECEFEYFIFSLFSLVIFKFAPSAWLPFQRLIFQLFTFFFLKFSERFEPLNAYSLELSYASGVFLIFGNILTAENLFITSTNPHYRSIATDYLVSVNMNMLEHMFALFSCEIYLCTNIWLKLFSVRNQ